VVSGRHKDALAAAGYFTDHAIKKTRTIKTIALLKSVPIFSFLMLFQLSLHVFLAIDAIEAYRYPLKHMQFYCF